MGEFHNAKRKALTNKTGSAVDLPKPRVLSFGELIEELGSDEVEQNFDILYCDADESDIVSASNGMDMFNDIETSSELTQDSLLAVIEQLFDD